MKAPHPTKAEQSAPSKRKFTGTDNPRHLRVLTVLLRRPISRNEVDNIGGCANGPALIEELRNLGLGHDHLMCIRSLKLDCDGRRCWPGVYSLSATGIQMVKAWRDMRNKGGA